MTDPRVNPQRLDPYPNFSFRVEWDGLPLGATQREQLREIAFQARERATTDGDRDRASRSARGPGIGVLLVGPTAAETTMAAEALASELRRDLHRVELGRVVSKYVGETEENLARVFDAAEERGAILLLDEADALFGRRTEVKDSHDRHANLEVGYLLHRMESRRGLTILITSRKEDIDDAFMRRLHRVVSFPAPGESGESGESDR